MVNCCRVRKLKTGPRDEGEGIGVVGQIAGRTRMLEELSSYTLIGIDAAPVEVEVDVSAASMPKTVLVGLAEAAVRESTHRVERALVNSGYQRPIDRVIINLAPAGFHCEVLPRGFPSRG